MPTNPLAKRPAALKGWRYVFAPQASPQGRQGARLLEQCAEPPGLWRPDGAAARAVSGRDQDSQRAAWCQTIEAFDDRARAGWGTRWLNVLKTLVTYRLIDPGSEWRLHRQWYEQSPMGDPLGEDFDLVQKDNLYRCLDKLLGHQHLVRAYRRVGEEVVEPNGLIAVLGQSVDTSVRLLSTASNSTAPRSSRLLSPNRPSAASFMRCHPVPEPMGHRVKNRVIWKSFPLVRQR